MQIMFLHRMVDKFQGSSKVLAESKGMNSILSKKALLKSGDTRLLLK